MKFKGFKPFLKQMRVDGGGWRISFDVDESQYDLIKDLPKFQDKILEISVEIDNEIL